MGGRASTRADALKSRLGRRGLRYERGITDAMGQLWRELVAAIYLLFLADFGHGLVLVTLWLRWLLSGLEIGTCVFHVVNPF